MSAYAVSAARPVPAAPPGGPPTDPAWRYGLHLAHDPRAPRIARATLALVLREHHLEALVETAELLTSELVTNAYRYSVGDVFVVARWTPPFGTLRVTVRDGDARLPNTCSPGDALSTRGRGLFLVRRLAHRHGHHDFTRTSGGKAVWFELRLGGA